MNSDELDALLMAWHRHMNREDAALGYPTECPSTRGYRASQQWRGCDVDDDGDVYLTAPDPFVAKAGELVQRLVNGMDRMHQMALAYQARTLVTGVWAIRHPRLPSDQDELVMLIADARSALMVLLDGSEILAAGPLDTGIGLGQDSP